MSKCSPEIPNTPTSYRPVHRASNRFWGFAAIFSTLVLSASCQKQEKPSAENTKPNLYQMVTGDESGGAKNRWDKLYSSSQFVFGKEPATFLRDNIHYAKTGLALDIAMGEGRNAVFLAKKGFRVQGVDISEVALRKARRLAKENNLSIETILADLNQYQIKPGAYDLIVNINYLQRNLIPQIKRGLKRGGVVIFESATKEQMQLPGGKSFSPDQLLERGELKKYFQDFHIIIYKETNDGADALASLVAMKMD